MKRSRKEMPYSCCGEPIYGGGHIPCSSTEPIDDQNSYYWLSFADEDRFYGVAIVECADGDPVCATWRLGINPGEKEDCDVTFQPLSPADYPIFKNYLGQLITDQGLVLKLAKLFH